MFRETDTVIALFCFVFAVAPPTAAPLRKTVSTESDWATDDEYEYIPDSSDPTPVVMHSAMSDASPAYPAATSGKFV